MRLIPTSAAARLLGLPVHTLRLRSIGEWADLDIGRLRVYRLGPNPSSERRFDADEILRLKRRAKGG